MTKKEADELWWGYFAECGSACGLPLPTRIPEAMGVVMGYITSMLSCWDSCQAVGSITVRQYMIKLASHSPKAYAWVVKTFPTIARAAASAFVSGPVSPTGTVALGTRALAVGEVGAIGAGMMASAYLGFVVGAACYASLRLRGFDLGAEGTALSGFFAWQQGNNDLNFFDYMAGAHASQMQGEDLRLRLAKRKADAVRRLHSLQSKHRINVPQAIHAKISKS